MDLNKFFLSSNFSNLSFPFWNQVMDAAAATTGEIDKIRGKTPSVHEEEARERFVETIKSTLIPQRRIGKQVADSYDAVQTGYALDKHAKLLYHATPWGEILRAAGIRPAELRQSKELVEEMRNRTAMFHLEERRAISEFVTSGDPTSVLAFEQKWHTPVTVGNIERYMKESGLTPEQRQLKRMPKALRPGGTDMLLENIP